MATGRMLKKNVSTSRKLAELKTDQARLLYTWMLAHLDIEGRFSADENVIKGLIVPRLKTFDETIIKECLKDMKEKELIILYEANGDKFLQYTKFSDFQILRPGREKESEIPAPPSLLYNTPSQPTALSVGSPAQDKISKDKISKDKISTDHRIKVLSDFWHDKFIEIRKPITKKPVFNYGQMGKIWEKLLPSYDIEIIKSGIIGYFKDEKSYYKDSGYDPGLFIRWLRAKDLKISEKQSKDIIIKGKEEDIKQKGKAEEAQRSRL